MVEMEFSISLERCCNPLAALKESLSLGRIECTTGLLDVRGGKNGRS